MILTIYKERANCVQVVKFFCCGFDLFTLDLLAWIY